MTVNISIRFFIGLILLLVLWTKIWFMMGVTEGKLQVLEVYVKKSMDLLEDV